MAEKDFLIINVSCRGVSAAQLTKELASFADDVPEGAEITLREPRRASGSLAMIDPGTVQIVLAILSGTGAVAIAVKGLFHVLNKCVETRASPVKVKIGTNTLELPPNVPRKDRARMYEEFLDRVQSRRK